jgi:hypothetical protein
MVATRTGREAMDVAAATDAHGFGPSLRALWAQAQRVGFDDAAAWAHVRHWAIRRPTLAKPPAATMSIPTWRARVRNATAGEFCAA